MEISQKVVEVCHVCDTTGVQPCGLQRKDLSRDPTLIMYPGAVFYVDELQIVSRETGSKMAGFHKVLVAICVFSHFVIVEPLFENLTQVIFLDFVQRRLIQTFGPIWALATDNASNLSGNLVQDVCVLENILKAHTNSYIQGVPQNMSHLI